MPRLPIDDNRLVRIKPDLISHSHSPLYISEMTGSSRGRQTLTLHTGSACLCLRLPRRPAGWLAAQACADALVFEFSDDGMILHLVELKSTVDPDEWDKIKKQLKGAYHNALAVRGVLELPDISAVKVIITCSEDRLGSATSATTASLKFGLGKPQRYAAVDWLERRVAIDDLNDIPLNIVIRDPDGNASAHLS